jgi:hypothetical protein
MMDTRQASALETQQQTATRNDAVQRMLTAIDNGDVNYDGYGAAVARD